MPLECPWVQRLSQVGVVRKLRNPGVPKSRAAWKTAWTWIHRGRRYPAATSPG